MMSSLQWRGGAVSFFMCFFYCLYISDVWVGSYSRTGHSVNETLDQMKNNNVKYNNYNNGINKER
jgi:hypothetical protein